MGAEGAFVDRSSFILLGAVVPAFKFVISGKGKLTDNKPVGL